MYTYRSPMEFQLYTFDMRPKEKRKDLNEKESHEVQ